MADIKTLNGYNLKDETARNQINDLENTVDLLKQHTSATYDDFISYYVNDSAGSDDNDGLTSATAFKTLGKFLSLYNTGLKDIRCYIQSPGNYYLDYNSFTSAVLHIVIQSNYVSVIANPSDSGRVHIYNSHWNITASGYNNCILVNNNQGADTYAFEFENTALTITNMNINGVLGFFDCYVLSTNCIYNGRLYLSGTVFRSQASQFTNTAVGTTLINVQNFSKILFTSAHTFAVQAEQVANSTALQVGSFSVAYVEVTIPAGTNYNYTLALDNGYIQGTTTRLNTWLNRGTAGAPRLITNGFTITKPDANGLYNINLTV